VTGPGSEGILKKKRVYIRRKEVDPLKRKKATTGLGHNLMELALAQLRDDVMIEGKSFEGENYRRKRSLKFRVKMRVKRSKVFGDSFHKQDREYKNANKVIAALRRKRDDAGKFNLEPIDTSFPSRLEINSNLPSPVECEGEGDS
jgi:hypothetical protein